MSKMKFEVYAVTFNDEVIYIGYGHIGRHRHTVSGISHNYDLNRIHFTEDASKVVVKVLKYFEDRDGAKSYESELIGELKPKYNVSETASIRKTKEQRSWLESVSDTICNKKVVDK